MVAQLGCADIPPPALVTPPGKLDSPATIGVVRPSKYRGNPWRINVNGTDVGVIGAGNYCTFHVDESMISFSADAHMSTGQWLLLIPLGLLFLPLVFVAIANGTADRYEPTNPPVRYPEAGSMDYLMLAGGVGGAETRPDE